jgi:tetratricopeptide (TPR) repeat protein
LINEHRTYLPSFGFFLIISLFINLLFWDKYKYIAIFIFALIIGSNSYLTYERNKIWKDDFTLWSNVLSNSPNKARAYFGLGFAYGRENKFEEAMKNFNKAIELQPRYPDVYNNRGIIFGMEKKYDESISNFNKAIELKADYPEAYFNRGLTYFNIGKKEIACGDLQKAAAMGHLTAIEMYNKFCR